MTFDQGGEKLPSKRPPYPGGKDLSSRLRNLESNIIAWLKKGNPWSARGGFTVGELSTALEASSDDLLAALDFLINKKIVTSAVSEITGKRHYYLTCVLS